MTSADVYTEIEQQGSALCADEPNLIANLANLSALMFERLEEVNWVGFYMNEHGADETLVLGPFQGKVACVRIPFGKGVCGTAAASRTTQLVADVHAFAGHIACDADSNAEIVLPIVVNDKVVAVLDIDSPRSGRFDENDRRGVEGLLKLLQSFDWSAYAG
ncbi:GAF domain-containing protein [Aliidiomarina sp. Khilg15.8]